MSLPGIEQSRTVVVIDDDTIIREGAARLFDRTSVLGSYRDVEQFIADRPECDVVILDLNLHGTGSASGVHGAAAVRAVRAAGYRVLLYTNERRLLVLAGCLAAGASGIVHKAEPIDVLEAAVDEVCHGGTVLTVALAGLAEAVREHGQMPQISARQREVLSGRARGESFKSIGRRLFISERTAQDHMNRVYEVFGQYLESHSVADLERHLGIGIGDLIDE